MKKAELIMEILALQSEIDPTLLAFDPYTMEYLKACDGSELRGIKAELDETQRLQEEIYNRDYIKHGRAE